MKVPDEVTEEKCDLCGRNMVIKSGRFGRFLACPGYPECTFTKPLVVEMPGRCPKCGGRLLKRTGVSQKPASSIPTTAASGSTAADESTSCDFMTWDVPVKDDCPVCGQTMFKKSGRGLHASPSASIPKCANFLPEDKRRLCEKAAEPRRRTRGCGEALPRPPEEPARRRKSSPKRLRRRPRKSHDENDRDHRKPRPRKPRLRRSRRGQKGPGGEAWNHVTVIGAGLAGSECCLAAGPAGHSRDPAGDEAGEDDPRPPDRRILRSWCCSNSLRGDRAGKRRGPSEGGAAAAGQPDPAAAPTPPRFPPEALWRWTATAFPGW